MCGEVQDPNYQVQKALANCQDLVLYKEANSARLPLSQNRLAWNGKLPEDIIGSFLNELRDFDASIKTLKTELRRSMLLTKQAYLIGTRLISSLGV